MEISNLKRSAVKVADGDWVRDIPQMGDLALKVRGIGYEAYKQTMARKLRAIPSKERERDGNPSEAALHRARGEALHEHVLLDWDGLTDSGKKLEYNSETALVWLTSPEFEDFHYAVVYAAGVVGKESKERIEGIGKN